MQLANTLKRLEAQPVPCPYRAGESQRISGGLYSSEKPQSCLQKIPFVFCSRGNYCLIQVIFAGVKAGIWIKEKNMKNGSFRLAVPLCLLTVHCSEYVVSAAEFFLQCFALSAKKQHRFCRRDRPVPSLPCAWRENADTVHCSPW